MDERGAQIGGEAPPVKSLEEVIRSKEEEITRLKEALGQKERSRVDGEKAIRSLEDALFQKETLLSKQHEELLRLKGIENTLAWRGIRRMFDLTESTLFPCGTRRGRLFFRLLNRLKANLEDGVQTGKVPGQSGMGGRGPRSRSGAVQSEEGSAGDGHDAERDPYSQKIAAELGNFEKVTKVHDLPPIYGYWSNKYLMPKLRGLGIEEFWNLFVDPVAMLWRECGRPIEITSLGSGNCDFELKIAQQIHRLGIPFEMHCYEINPAMLDRGKELIQREGLSEHFRFVESDLNRVRFDQEYDVFIANHSLHHFLNLEHIFQAVRSAMRPNGYFIVNDMIGRNGHMLWPEAYAIFSQVWSSVPKEKKWNQQNRTIEETYPNWDYSKDGFEGIRAQEILPLLIKSFQFELFCAFSNIIDLFIGRAYGQNFKADDPEDLALIDYVAQLDETCIREGKIKPTHLIAWMVLRAPERMRAMDGLNPEDCVRIPSAGDGSMKGVDP